MPWQEPKTNWVKNDYYNFEDLDRVENNTALLAEMITDYSGMHIVITIVLERDVKRFEFYDSMNRIEENIQTLADNFYEPIGWETVKTDWLSGKRFDYRDANRLEKNLLLLYNLLTKVLDSMNYCGTFACGEDVI